MQTLAAPDRQNNFSLLRLLFASLVIVSHSFALIDGNVSREPLVRCFGTISFGMFAVDGFFLVSGYLITASLLGSTLKSYILKRVLRIYPGFIAAFIISLVLGEFVSFHRFNLPADEVLHNIVNFPFLLQPIAQNIYPGFAYPGANDPMWTIFYEFHCYLLIAVLGLCGILSRRWLFLAATAALMLHFLLFPDIHFPGAFPQQDPNIQFSFGKRLWLIGESISVGMVKEDLRLAAIFLTGSCYYIFRDLIPYRYALAVTASVLALSSLFFPNLAEPGLAVFGGYVFFWFALHTKAFKISKICNKTDISYGVYLYAWPIQKILTFYIHGITTYQLICYTLLLSAIAGYLSWSYIEKPCLNLSHRLLSRPTRSAGGM